MTTAAGPSSVSSPSPPRTLPRYNLGVVLDVTVLRSGVPDRIPGRSVDISDRGLGIVVAGELFSGESVGVDFLLPGVEKPVQARAVVRHHQQLRCGIEFQDLTPEQRTLIHSWTRQRNSIQPSATVPRAATAAAPVSKAKPKRGFKARKRLAVKIGLLTVLAASLVWWRWQRGWTEIEAQLPVKTAVQPKLIVPAEVMEQRILHKVDPVHPDAARLAHLQGAVVLRAVISSDGRVVNLQSVGGPEPLARAALEAVRWWRYDPYLLNGTPVEVETTIQIPFSDFRVNTTGSD